MKIFALALLVALISLSELHAKEEKKKKDPSDDFDIENIRNGEWVAIAIEPKPESSNIYNSQSIRQAVNQYENTQQQQDLPTNSFTLPPPGFQQPQLGVLHRPPNHLSAINNEKPTELEMLYNEFLRQKTATNPLSANLEVDTPNSQMEFEHFLNRYTQKNAQDASPININTYNSEKNFEPFSSAMPQQKQTPMNSMQIPTNPLSSNNNGNQMQEDRLYKEFLKQRTQNIASNPTSVHLNDAPNPNLKLEFFEYLRSKVAPTQPPFNVKSQYPNDMNNQIPIRTNTQYTNERYNNEPTQDQKETQSQSFLDPQNIRGQEQNQDVKTIQPVVPLSDIIKFIRLQSDTPAPSKDTPNTSGATSDMTETTTSAPPSTGDPHDDKSYLLTDNDEFKIARDPNGNAILLSMVSNNGEWPAQTTHYAGSGHGYDYSQYGHFAASNSKPYTAYPLSAGGNVTTNQDFTSIQDFQYKTQDRPENYPSSGNFQSGQHFLGKRQPIAIGYSPTKDPKHEYLSTVSPSDRYKTTLNPFDQTQDIAVTQRHESPHFLASRPSTAASKSGQIGQNYYDDYTTVLETEEYKTKNVPSTQPKHFLSERPSTFASEYQTILGGQKGQTEGSSNPDFLTTQMFRTGHEYIHDERINSFSHTSSSDETDPYTRPIAQTTKSPFGTTPNFLSTRNTPAYNPDVTPTEYSSTIGTYPSNDETGNNPKSEYFTASYKTSPFQLSEKEYAFLVRQEGNLNPESVSNPPLTTTVSIPASTLQFTTLKVTQPTTEFPPTTANFADTTLSIYPTPTTSSDEEEANLPPYNPYPNRPSHTESSQQPLSPSQSIYANYLSNNFTSSSNSHQYGYQHEPPQYNFQSAPPLPPQSDYQPASVPYIYKQKPPQSSFQISYSAPNVNKNPQHFGFYTHENSKQEDTYSSYPKTYNSPQNIPYEAPNKYRERHENSYQTFSNKPPQYGNYRPQNDDVAPKPKPIGKENSWLTSNYLSKPYYSSEIYSRPEIKNSYNNQNSPPSTSFQYVQQSFVSKPENVQYSVGSSYYAPNPGSYFSAQSSSPYQSYGNGQSGAPNQVGSQGNLYLYQGGESTSHPTLVAPEPMSTTVLASSTTEASVSQRNIPKVPHFQSKQDIWSILKLPLESKQEDDAETMPPKPATNPVSTQPQETLLTSYPIPKPPVANYQVQSSISLSYPESSFVPSNGPFPPPHGLVSNYPKPSDVSSGTSQNNHPSYTLPLQPQGSYPNKPTYPKPTGVSYGDTSNSFPPYPQLPSPTQGGSNPLNTLQDVLDTPNNTVDQYTGEELEPIYLPSDNCTTTFMVREDRQSVLGVRAMPGGSAECELTFLSPRADRRLALQLLGLSTSENNDASADCSSAAVSVFSQKDGRNLLVREFCGQIPTSPAILTEGHSALVTVRAQPGSQRAGFTILAFLW